MRGDMAALLLGVCLLLVEVGCVKACASEQFTAAGECCRMCAAGTGLASSCGHHNTKCQKCQDGVSFSDSESLSACRSCARCPPGVAELARCTVSQDTQCDCGEHFFLWREDNSTRARCEPCTMCAPGSGVFRPCGALGDTVCQQCQPGTYSKERSDRKPCVPCTRCSEDEVEIRPCQPASDTICMVKDLNILSRPDVLREFPQWPVVEEVDNGGHPAPGSDSPQLTPQDQGGNNILVYVSVLAAVVLGLLIYVAYKCWRSCQQKRALVKARVAELNNAAEGEKLHSDSGVFLDSHSLQETQPSKGSKRDSKQDTRLYVNLPPQRQEEVERLLAEGGGRCWRNLAASLGYEQERVDVFGRGEDPIHTLLSDWSQREGSTLGLLCSALTRIERPDVIGALTAPSQGLSVV